MNAVGDSKLPLISYNTNHVLPKAKILCYQTHYTCVCLINC